MAETESGDFQPIVPAGITVNEAANQIGLFRQEAEDGAVPSEVTPEEEPEEATTESEAVAEETAEVEDETAEDAEPEQDQETEAAPETTYEVTVSGKTQEVTLDELRGGYAREADYRQKTQSLADERRTFESGRDQIAAELNRRLEATNQLYSQALDQLTGGLGEEPNWDQLRADDPDAYIEQNLAWTDKLRKRQTMEQQVEQLRQHQTQQQQQYLAYLQNECAQKLSETLPSFTDSKNGASYRTELEQYGQTAGYSVQELAGWVDPRAYGLLDKAMKYDRIMSKKKPLTRKETKVKGVKPAKSGAGVSAEDRQAESRQQAMDRLRRRPKDRHAQAAAIAAIRGA
tara:strand:- start:9282 stop:10316 length:1035 start_codon:yes stop_codon:yes gene_type:complete